MKAMILPVVIAGLLLVIATCDRPQSSRCHSVCVRCGRIRFVKVTWGITMRDTVHERDLSKWLAQFRSGPCDHEWHAFAGWSSRTNWCWDGSSHYAECLHNIKRLHATLGDAETRKLLARYDTILDMPNGQPKRSALEALRKELKAQLDQITPEPGI